MLGRSAAYGDEMHWIELYLILGLLYFLVRDAWEDRDPVNPGEFYTIGLVIIVLTWPFFLLSDFYGGRRAIK